MTDYELIQQLFNLLWEDLTDGDTPTDAELSEVRLELEKRGLNSGSY